MSRVRRSKDEVRAAYDRMSKWYDTFADGAELKLVDIGLQRLQVRSGERVLEIGFGTGRAILGLARLVGDSGKVSGLDLSAGMLRAAQEKVPKLALRKGWT